MTDTTERAEALRLADLMSAMDYEDTIAAAAWIRASELEIKETGWKLACMTIAYGEAMESLKTAVAERDKLRAEVERLRPNALRYEWLRSDDVAVPDGQREICVVLERLPFREDQSDEVLTGSALDTAIDRAIESAKEQQHG